jgi:hypothetical protein
LDFEELKNGTVLQAAGEAGEQRLDFEKLKGGSSVQRLAGGKKEEKEEGGETFGQKPEKEDKKEEKEEGGETFGQKPEKEDKKEEKEQEHEEKEESDGDSKDDHGKEQGTDEKQEKDKEGKEEKGEETDGKLPERPMEPMVAVGRDQLMDFPDFGDEVKQDGRKIIVLDLRYLFGNHPLPVSPYYWTGRYKY